MTQYYSSKKMIIVVGTTRTGKSTIIKYTTGQNVKTSNGFKSHTPDYTAFSIDSNTSMLDTVGCEDSSGLSSDKILDKIIQFLGPRNIQNIQVIWTVDPQLGSTPAMQKQAEWINKLHKNIWDSTVIICKLGTSSNSSKGALGSVSYVTYKNPESYNLALLDKCEEDSVFKMFEDMNYDTRSKKGVIYTRELKSWLLGKLRYKSTCTISYSRKHTNIVYVHRGSKVFKHWGEKTYKYWHSGTFDAPIITYKYKILFWESDPIFSLPGTSKWSCCGSKDQNARGCHKTFEEWTCCEMNEYSSGCRFSHWSCCSQTSEYAQGCSFSRYACCGKTDRNAPGCHFYL